MDVVPSGDQTLWTHGISLIAVLMFAFLAGILVVASRLPSQVKAVLCVGLGLRVVGAMARFQVLQLYYGAGDASGYFGKGIGYSRAFRQLDFSPITDGKQWYGTEFVRTVSGIVITIIGPSMFSEFVVFSLLGFLGLIAFGVAYRRAYPSASPVPYMLLIFFFPSLWFWPSSIGKEALVLLGCGVTVLGYTGKRNQHVNWPLFVLGLLMVFAVRPQVVPVILAAVIISQWLSFTGRWTVQRALQGVMILMLGVFGIAYGLRTMGIEDLGMEGITEFVETDKARETAGSTSVGAVSTNLTGIPVAIFNILFRPLPWEATNVMVLLSSLEVLALWAIVYVRRKRLKQVFRYWRSDRLIRLSIAFVILYSAGLGMMLVNVGIIARQRIFLYPFLFLLIEAMPHVGGGLYERRPISAIKRRVQMTPRLSDIPTVRPVHSDPHTSTSS